MALTTVTNGNTANANDLNQVINVLQVPAAGTETGEYVLSQGCHASADFVSAWCASQSRNTTPVSVSVDTSIGAPSNCNAPSTFKLSNKGFQVVTTSTAATANASVAGLFTIQY